MSDRVHNNDVGFLSFLGYPVFHHEHFLGGKHLIFLLTSNIDKKSEVVDKWPRLQAVRMDAGRSAPKAAEFSSFYL